MEVSTDFERKIGDKGNTILEERDGYLVGGVIKVNV